MRRLRRCAQAVGLIVVVAAAGARLQAQPAPAPTTVGPGPGPGNPTLPPDQSNPAPAQNPAAPGPASRPAATQPVLVFLPASQPATRPTRISLNFKDASLDTVLDYLSQAIGFVIIKEGQVDGRVTVMSKQPVTPEEAVTILNASLRANGFAAIGSGRELRIIARDKAKKSNVPVHFGADPKDIESTDEIITQVIPIQNVDAMKLREELKPLMPQDADAVTANEASNSIVITDSSSNIRHIVEIIAALDQHESTISDIRIVQLKWANAAATVKLIQAIFKSEPAGPQMPQPGMPMQPGQPQPGGGGKQGRVPGSGIDKALRGAKINAASDDRTNTIVITGPTETLKVIDNIIVKLDANQQAASELRAYPLKYAEAEPISKLILAVFKGDQNENRNDDFFFFRPSRSSSDDNLKIKINVSFDARTNTVIVTAPPDILKAIDGLLEKLDANPGGASDIRIYPLQYADAYSVSKLITSTFNPEDGSNRRFIPFFIFGDGPANQQKGPKVSASSDDRTNTLVVTAPTEMFPTIEKIVRQLDTNPIAEEAVFIYRLKNGQASNLEVVLNTLFGNIQGNNGQQQNQNGPQGFNQPFGGQNQNGGGPGRGNGGGPGNSSFGSRRSSNGPGNRSNSNNNNQRRGNGSQLSPGALQAINMLTGEAFVVADTDTNSLIVTTATKYKEQVREIIDELDRPVPQVLIKVLIAEVTHNNSADFGTDFSILNTRPNGLGQSFGQTFGNPGSGLIATVVENKLNVQLHALAVAGKLDVLSRPYILASDNQLSSILVGSSVPFITDSRITDLGQTINSIQYDDIGITLDVTPHINPDGLVIMDVAPGISQLTDQTVPITSNVSAPVIAKRSAQSRVGVKDGQTIVIGGMMQDNKTSTVNKVPILGDIPILQLAFSRTQITKTKTELLIFLTPHVAQQPDTLKPMAEDEIKGTRLTPRAVGPGVFDEHRKGLEHGNIPETRPSSNSPSIRDIEPPVATQPSSTGMQVKRNPTEPYSAPLHAQ